MALQNMQHLSRRRHGHTGILPLLTGLEVDHEIQLLHARGHHIRHPLHHVKQMMDLSSTSIRVLPPGIQILTRTALLIEPQYDLLARLLLGRDVLGREVVDAVLPTPRQRIP